MYADKRKYIVFSQEWLTSLVDYVNAPASVGSSVPTGVRPGAGTWEKGTTTPWSSILIILVNFIYQRTRNLYSQCEVIFS